MRFEMIDGHVYEGATYKELVENMAADKLTEARTIRGYRYSTAERVRNTYGGQIEWSTDQRFVKSLCKAGLMRQVS